MITVHRVEQVFRAEAALLQVGYYPALRQNGEAGKQSGAVHQRPCRQMRTAAARYLGLEEFQVRMLRKALAVFGVEAEKQVLLAPHDALRQTRGAAGVKQQQIVARHRPGAPVIRPNEGGGSFIRRRPSRARRTAVVNPEPQLYVGHPRPNPIDHRNEGAVEYDASDVAIFPKINELIRAITVVGVERHETTAKRGERGLEIFETVKQILRHLVLPLQSGIDQKGCKRRSAPIEVPPNPRPVTLNQSDGVRDFLGYRSVDVGEIPTIRHGALASCDSASSCCDTALPAPPALT